MKLGRVAARIISTKSSEPESPGVDSRSLEGHQTLKTNAIEHRLSTILDWSASFTVVRKERSELSYRVSA